MNWLIEIANDKSLQSELQSFCTNYGTKELKQALKLYIDMNQKYICKTKSSIFQIRLIDIYYLTIQEHDISVHTKNNVYHKYGTLNKELKFLAKYNFRKCNQSCIVSLDKIEHVFDNNLILIDGSRLYMSRNYTGKILYELSKRKIR